MPFMPLTGVGPPPVVFNFATSLVGYWRLDEASGSRADNSGNANTLTDNNTVTSTTGQVGTAATFTRANSERLSRADQASFETAAASWTACGWARFTTLPGLIMGLVSKWNAVGTIGYRLHLDTGSKPSVVSNPDGGAGITATWGSALSTATWYFIAGGYDAGTQKVWVSVNAGTPVSSSAAAQTLPDGTHEFQLGAVDSAGHLNGDMDEWGFWNGRVLTAAELTYIYNGGTGRQLF